jgi:hypothetical protein
MATADPDGRPSTVDLKQHFDTSQDQRWRGYTIPRKHGPRKSWMWRQRGNCTSRGLASNKFVGGRVRASACVHVGGCARGWVCACRCARERVFARTNGCAWGVVLRVGSACMRCCAAGGGWTARRGCGRRGRIRNSSTHVQLTTPTPAPPRSTRAPVTCAASGTLRGAFWARVEFCRALSAVVPSAFVVSRRVCLVHTGVGGHGGGSQGRISVDCAG